MFIAMKDTINILNIWDILLLNLMGIKVLSILQEK